MSFISFYNVQASLQTIEYGNNEDNKVERTHMDSGDSTDAVVSTLRQIIRAVDIQSKHLTKKFGLTGPQLLVLKEIRKSPDSQISEISRNVSLSQATVTSILDRLEQQGFAERRRSQTDKRKVHILLTEKSEELLKLNPSLLQEKFSLRLLYGR